jgi:hypothetical protein
MSTEAYGGELPDYRIRLDPTEIDFEADVGTSGQEHDEYPSPNSPARYDWMRSYLIGLLTLQASYGHPKQYREGTLWANLNTNCVEIYSDSAWRQLAECVQLDESLSLAQWYEQVKTTLAAIGPDVVFNGTVTANGVTNIPIPAILREHVTPTARCFLYVDGVLADPRMCLVHQSTPPTAIELNGFSLSRGSIFTAILRMVPSTHFYESTVSVP